MPVSKIVSETKKTDLEVKFVGDYEPTYGTEDSACFDLKSAEKVRIFPGELAKVDLGIKVEIPKGYYMQLIPRSSFAKTGLILANSLGIVDADYRGQVFAPIRNVGKVKAIIDKGDRIIQGIIRKVDKVKFKKVTKLSETKRAEGGYGSTGR